LILNNEVRRLGDGVIFSLPKSSQIHLCKCKKHLIGDLELVYGWDIDNV
jgi:hypothetical protein